MRFPPEREAAVNAALDRMIEAAKATRQQPDAEAVRKALNAVWWTVHHAAETLNEAERQTRNEAVQQLEGKAA